MSTTTHARTPSSSTTVADGDNPQSMVITSLRSQVSDLMNQVTQLNSKLVQSYDRISDLEDSIHVTSSNLRNSTLKISQLELERTQHLSALNTGLLVEKAHVTSELTRLMERATDEAARRGKAESARQEIEKDLDDLSAELFDRANTMVAEARFSQAKSERRVQDAEAMLKTAEEAVASMQSQMQTLREDKDRTDRELDKGKWVERERPPHSPAPIKLLSSHVPYQEFLLFVAHLRQIRPSMPQQPPMATFLPLPFLTRLVAEDTEPTLRLDTAPSLNWLSRRSVTTAVHQSQLIVEPLSISTLLELFPPTPFQQNSAINVPCALCGKSVLPSSYTASAHSQSSAPTGTPNSWRPTFLSRQSSSGTPTRQNTFIHSPSPSVATVSSLYPASSSTSTRLSPPLTPPPPSPPVSPVYVFRLFPSSQSSQSQSATVYPLCTTGWCLSRVRTTCELWRFVRTGILDKVWEEEYSTIGLTPTSQRSTLQNGSASPATNGKPPLPPRRRLPTSVNVGMGKLFGMASSALSKSSSTPTKQNGSAAPAKTGAPPPLPRRNELRSEKGDELKRRDTANTEFALEEKAKSSRLALEDTKQTLDSTVSSTDDTTSHTHDTPNATILTTHPKDPSEIPLPDTPMNTSFQVNGTNTHNTPPKNESETTPVPSVQGASQPVPSASPTTSPDLGADTTSRPVPASTLSSTLEPSVPTALSAPPPLPRRAARRTAPVPPSDENATPNPQLNANTKLSEEDGVKNDNVKMNSAGSNVNLLDANAGESSNTTGNASGTASGAGAGTGETPKTTDFPSVPQGEIDIPLTSEPGSIMAADTPVTGEASDMGASSTQAQAQAQSEVAPAAAAAPTGSEAHTDTNTEAAPAAVSSTDPANADNDNKQTDATTAASLTSGPTQPSAATELSSAPTPVPPPRPSEDLHLHRTSTPSDLHEFESSQRRTSVSTSGGGSTGKTYGGSAEHTGGGGGSSNGTHVEDLEVYIGNTTWEERTWKVLVRLREDMFYARIGCVR